MMEEAGVRQRTGSGSAVVPNKANDPSQITKREKPGAYLGKACKKNCKWQALCSREYWDTGRNVNQSVNNKQAHLKSTL